MRKATWIAAFVFSVALAGCNQDHTGLTTVPAGTSNGLSAGTGTATLSWEAPTTTTNGSHLSDLGGYRIYYGTDSNDLSESVQLNGTGIQTYVIDDLGTGTWYFAIRAVTTAGVESALSEIVSKTI